MIANSKLTKKQFEKELFILRELVGASTKPLAESGRQARIGRAAKDMKFFAETYFPHYTTCAASELHKYFAERYPQLIFKAMGLESSQPKGSKEADAAPRGHAKSTWTTLILPLWTSAFKYRHFTLIVSETADQAEDFISFIKIELEVNERLAQDFPELCGVGAVWRTRTLITKNGVKIRGVGAGQKLRGMRHGAKRPDLVIGDDLENDEAVMSAEQRKKLAKWFFRALMKIGQPDTVYIVVGTILHHDSLLSELLVMPGWGGRIFKAVKQWAISNTLWELWENIFRDFTASKEQAEQAADTFFQNNKFAMLEGAEVLWPEREPYYDLMKMRLTDGAANFASEKQNEPVDPDDALFNIADVSFWEDGNIDLSNAPFFGAVDPSLGKKAKRNDPSAILGGWWQNGILWLEIADEAKRKPDKIIDDVFTYHERHTFDDFAAESVQFQEYFATSIETEAKERGKTLPITQINSSSDKYLRIQRLQPWIKNGWVRFKKHHRNMLTQIEQYPMCSHDDLLDCLEMLISTCEKYTRKPKREKLSVVTAAKNMMNDILRGFE